MLSSALRVLARSAALQLEEAALASRSSARKGKGRAEGPSEIRHVNQPRSSSQTTWSTSTAATSEATSQPTLASSSKLPDGMLSPRTIPSSAPDTTTKHRGPDSHRLDEVVVDIPVADSGGAEVPGQSGLEADRKLPDRNLSPKILPQSQSESTSPLLTKIDQHKEDVTAPLASLDPPSSITSQPDNSPLTAFDPLSPPEPQTAPESKAQPLKVEPENTILTSEEDDAPVTLRASKVPSSRIGRLFHYGSLAASLSMGAASESFRRSTGGGGQGSVFMSDANVKRLVATLGKMRGAALKLGQFMSIQDNHMLPPEIEKVLQQVQAHANYMPDWQMERVMSTELGSDWQNLFSSFDRMPFASASIGQVHKATLASTNTPVAVKIQFPGIASSIESDLSNLSILIRSSALLPKGLYLQNTIAVMRRELEDECDYIREGESGRRFHRELAGDDFFVVPQVFDEATTGKVLTSEWMSGKPLSRMKNMSQETRDKIGKNILRLCLQELFKFRFMQTDPNWANFMYDQQNDKLQLIDFGASREYTKEFMDGWFRLLRGALTGDREVMRQESLNLGYLTGEENEEMLDAHLKSMSLVASPFCHEGKYEFANQTITDSVRALIPIMLRHRLTPPPPETYSLNRKLSGAFLMCARLGANVDCQQLWEEHVAGYKEGPE